jgi:anti-sigma B factor antagonist
VDGIIVLDISGKILGGNESAALSKEIDRIIDAEERNLVLNLKEVPWMNSSGLGILLAAFIRLRSYGGILKFLHVQERVRAILVTTKLVDILEVYNDEKAAIDSFSAARQTEPN